MANADPNLNYQPFGEVPKNFVKHHSKIFPFGQTVDLEEVTYEATLEEIGIAGEMGISVDLFEQMIDIFEKLTGFSEFKEELSQCQIMCNQIIPSRLNDSFGD